MTLRASVDLRAPALDKAASRLQRFFGRRRSNTAAQCEESGERG
jgi:hypothetical protein